MKYLDWRIIKRFSLKKKKATKLFTKFKNENETNENDSKNEKTPKDDDDIIEDNSLHQNIKDEIVKLEKLLYNIELEISEYETEVEFMNMRITLQRKSLTKNDSW